DKELLELAARAAGMDYLVWTPGVSPLVPGEKRINGQMVWNPIHDDGDALRLAVKLRLDIQINSDDVTAISADVDGWVSELVIDENVEAATRRAIVRAAAALAQEQGEKNGNV